MTPSVPFTDLAVPPPRLAVAERRIDVWRFDLAVPDPAHARLAARLGDDERRRADRLRIPARRRRFEVARGILRGLLARYTGEEPERIRFVYGEHGKPALAAGGAPRFGVAHSDDVALVAVHATRDVGVDVEVLRHVPNLAVIARRFLSAADRAALTALPEAERSAAFLTGWTRTEACIKLAGGALFAELPRLTVETGAAGTHRALRRDDAGERRFVVTDLRPGPGLVGAVAVEGQPADGITGRYWAAPPP